jgi:hypothetical protein
MPGIVPPNMLCIAGGIIPGPMGPPKPDIPIGPIDIGFIIDPIGDIMPGPIPGPIIGKGLIPDIIGFPLIIEAAIIGFIIDPMLAIPPIGFAGAAIVTYPASFIPGGGADPGAPTMAPAGTPVIIAKRD